MTTLSANWTSVNAACQPLVAALLEDAQALQLEISSLINGTTIVDAGIKPRWSGSRPADW